MGTVLLFLKWRIESQATNHQTGRLNPTTPFLNYFGLVRQQLFHAIRASAFLFIPN